MPIVGLRLCRCCFFLSFLGPIAALIRGLRLPSTTKPSWRIISILSATVPQDDDLGPTNLHRAMRNLSDMKSIDSKSIDRSIDRPQQSESNEAKVKLKIVQEIQSIDRSIDRPQQSESNEANVKLKIVQEIKRIAASLQLSDSSTTPDVQQIEEEDKDLLGMEAILNVLNSKNVQTGTSSVTSKEPAVGKTVKYEESADITGLKKEEEFDDMIDVVNSNKQSKMKLYAFLDMDENADSLLCPQCDSPCDEDDMNDFGKCTFCRQKDLRDPSVHRIQYSDFSSYSNDVKSATRSSGTAVTSMDQRFLIEKQRKERNERLTSVPSVVIEPKSQPAAALPQAKSPTRSFDNDKANLSDRKFEKTLQPVMPIQQNQIYTVKSEERSDEQQSAQLRDKGFQSRSDFDEDSYSNSQEDYSESDDFFEKLEALERIVKKHDINTFEVIEDIRGDMCRVMSVSLNN
jgi:hypothetical protein